MHTIKTRRSERHDLPQCATPGCNEAANGACGFCAACYQWNRKGIHFSSRERDEYLYKRRRLVSRAEALEGIHATPAMTVSEIFSHSRGGSIRASTAARRSARRKARSR